MTPPVTRGVTLPVGGGSHPDQLMDELRKVASGEWRNMTRGAGGLRGMMEQAREMKEGVSSRPRPGPGQWREPTMGRTGAGKGEMVFVARKAG